MPFNTDQHREYQNKRRQERLALAVERLGGKCVQCGATERLEFDHVVPGTRARKVSEATNWSMERFLAEVDKCQLLCKDCHEVKTTAVGERSRGRKLSPTAAWAIRTSSLPQSRLMKIFGIGETQVQSVKTGKSWKQVDSLTNDDIS